MPAAGEVLVQLATHEVDASSRPQDTRACEGSERLESCVGVGVEREIREAVIGHRREHGADLRLEDVVGHVDEVERGGRIAEAAIEVRRNRHRGLLSLRSRRTPEEVACRAGVLARSEDGGDLGVVEVEAVA